MISINDNDVIDTKVKLHYALAELLNLAWVKDFDSIMILGPKPTWQDIKDSHAYLIGEGFSHDDIRANAGVLAFRTGTLQERLDSWLKLGYSRNQIISDCANMKSDSQTIKENFNTLLKSDLGFTKRHVLGNTKLPSMKYQTIKEKFKSFMAMGFTRETLLANCSILLRKPEEVKSNIDLIMDLEIGFTKEFLLRNPEIAGFAPFTLKSRYENLMGLGFTNKKLFSHPRLLNRDIESLAATVKCLSSMGISANKIISQPRLLTITVDVLNSRHDFLLKLGIPKDAIFKDYTLLTYNSKTIMKNYSNLRRYMPKERIVKSYYILITVSSESINAVVPYLASLGYKLNAPKDENLFAKLSIPLLFTCSVRTLRARVAAYVKKDMESSGKAIPMGDTASDRKERSEMYAIFYQRAKQHFSKAHTRLLHYNQKTRQPSGQLVLSK